MNRIEKVRETVDKIILDMNDNVERRCAYLHLDGVAQACALLAIKRKENIELAVIAGMLHDIYSYAAMDSSDHAHKGSEMARDIMNSLSIFTETEIDQVCTAIYRHSDKSIVHEQFDEILKDADVMQKVLYNPLFEIKNDQKRFDSLKEELHLFR